MSRLTPLLVGLIIGAAHAAAPGEPAPAPLPDVLVLERTACSGDCPVYTLTLQRNGRVHFTGVKNVALVGEKDWKIEPLFAQHLFGEFERSGFLKLSPRYPTEVEEFPGVVLTLTVAGVAHRVQLGGDGTAELARSRRRAAAQAARGDHRQAHHLGQGGGDRLEEEERRLRRLTCRRKTCVADRVRERPGGRPPTGSEQLSRARTSCTG